MQRNSRFEKVAIALKQFSYVKLNLNSPNAFASPQLKTKNRAIMLA
jgi:hypothetical protein